MLWCLRRVAQGAWSSRGPRAGVSDLRPQLLQLRGLPFGVAQFHEQWLLSPSFVALPLNLPRFVMVNGDRDTSKLPHNLSHSTSCDPEQA